MRPLLTALALLAAAPALAGAPLALVERQVVTLEFSRPVARLATTDPDLLSLEAAATRLKVTARRAGRAQLDVIFDDGAVAAFDVVVAPLRPAAPDPAPPGEVVLAVGERRRLPAPGLARLLLEENGVVHAQAEPGAVVLTGASAGRASVVLVDGAGRQTPVAVRVVP